MRIRLLEDVGFMLAGSCPSIPDREAEALIRQGNSFVLSDSLVKDMKPKKDKMVRQKKTK